MRIQNMELVLGTAALLQPSKRWPEYGDPERRMLLEAVDDEWGGIGSEQVRLQEIEFRQLLQLPPSWASVSTTNGTQAIQLIMEALGIGYGNRVIVPGMTWQATAATVADINAIPVILDVNDTWTLDCDIVEEYLAKVRGSHEWPVAMIAVPMYNRAPDMARLFKICQENGLWLIEDAAHGQGAVVHGRPVMGWGVANSTSGQKSKPRTTGERGDMVTCVPVIEARLRSLRTCGRPEEATIDPGAHADEVVAYWRQRVAEAGLKRGWIQSGNYRPTNFVDAVARAQNQRFWEQHQARQRTLAVLDRVMPTLPGIRWVVQPEVTSPVCYRIAFEYEPAQFAGMDNETFREALWFLLGGSADQKVEQPYEPLNDSPYYRPHTKPRHQISADYVRAITPGQWDLPRSLQAYRCGITIEQSAAREDRMGEVLPQAVALIHERAEQIVDAAR